MTHSILRWLLFAILLSAGLFPCRPSYGQVGGPSSDDEAALDAVPDSMQGTWMYDASARLNASQAAYKDWTQGGGVSTLAFTAGLGGEAARRGEHWIQSHRVELAYGLINQEEQEIRKAADEIKWNSSIRYEGEGFFRRFNPTIAADLRTQFAKGFDYSENPFKDELSDTTDARTNLNPPVQTSAFFSPAFITESIGLTYEPISYFRVRFGGASKQTVVRDRDFRVLYGVSENTSTRLEAGAELAAELDRQFSENIRYRSQLNVFLAFNRTEEPPDARWENTINLKVNDWLSTDLEFVALFDQDIANTIQLKETISVGVSFTLL